MQHLKITTFLFLLCFSAILDAKQKTDIDDFVNTFKDAISKNDISKIIQMNEWSGLPEAQRQSIEASFSDLATRKIVNLRVEKVPNGETIIFKKKGNTFAPNLIPVAQLFIEVTTDKKFRGGYSYYIGKSDVGLKFCHIVLKN